MDILKEQMLMSLKTNLGITAQAYDAVLMQCLASAREQIVREGATDLNETASVGDLNLVVNYAAWMWRKRDTMEGMPRMLRWQLNNRVLAVKAK